MVSPSVPLSELDDAIRIAHEHKLYGRDREVYQLTSSLRQTCRGHGEVLLLPGLSGTGKTALARVLRAPTQARNGYFLEGKFNQYDQNVPYVAWRQALAEFCEYINREDDEQRQKWVADISSAVGIHGQLLVYLVPEFETLLGVQAPVESINPMESRHRFAGVIRSVLQTICRPEHPLVLFIDDWQWADPASMQLLSQIQVGSTLRYLLVVAAYRSDEVDAHHDFIITLNELQSQSVTVKSTSVGDLALDEVETLVSETLSEFSGDLKEVAVEIHSKTKGNPFFAQALVNMIQGDGLAGETASQIGLASDVVDIFAYRISKLKYECQELLSCASLLGSRFDLETLATVSQKTVEECNLLLQPATPQFVEPLEMVQTARTPGDDVKRLYQFTHDRVQQAAYSRVQANDMATTRLKIARRLQERLTPEELSERAGEVADFFNSGISLTDDPAERIRGVELNVSAARRARSASAYRSALQYHRAARDCVNTSELMDLLWTSHPVLALSLFTEHAETEFLEGDREESAKCLHIARQRAQTPIQRAAALTVLIVQYTLQARYSDAIETGREALSELGTVLPREHYEAARDSEIAETRRLLQGKSPADILELPIANDEYMKATARVLITLGPPCYRAHQQLWSVIVTRVVNLTLKHGHIPEIGYSHTAFAGLLGWVANDYTLGREFAEIASKLMSGNLASASHKSVFHLMNGSSVRHWYQHLAHCSEDYESAIQVGKLSGNLQYAAYAFGHNMYCRFFQGTRLDELITESKSSLAFSRTRFNQWALDLLEGGLHIFGNLSTLDSGRDSSWESDYLRGIEAHHNQQVGCIYGILRTQQCLVMCQFEEALNWSEFSKPILYTVGTQGLMPWAEFVFARAVVLCQFYSQERQAELDALINQLRIWSEVCPDNFEHKYIFVKAEMARLSGRDDEASEMYDLAIASAHVGGFRQWEGMANERASKFWRARGNGRLEQVYWHNAYLCFQQWGAARKIEAMTAEYREFLTTALASDDSGTEETTHNPTVSERFTDRHVQYLLDQASRASAIRDQAKAAITAEELGHAADSLRADVAARRRTSENLRRQRDLQEDRNDELERRVKERTEELELLTAELKAANETLQRSNQELEQVAYVASHDLQEPLRKMSSFGHLLLEECGNDLTDDGREYLDVVIDGAARLKALVTDLLSFSRINSHGKELNSTSAKDCFDAAINNLGLVLAESKAEVTCDSLPIVFADASQLTMLFQNLIENAIKYCERIPRIHIGGQDVGDEFEFCVRDNGIGIEPEYFERIFEIFKRLHPRQEYSGTGIGLANCKRIVERFSGEIWLESTPGKGSEFYVRIRKDTTCQQTAVLQDRSTSS